MPQDKSGFRKIYFGTLSLTVDVLALVTYLEFMEGVGSVCQQQLYHREMTPGTGQGQGRVVIVGGLPVHIRVLTDEELDGTQVTSTARFHQRCSTSFRLMFLKQQIITFPFGVFPDFLVC